MAESDNAAERLTRTRALEVLLRQIGQDEILPRYLSTQRQLKSDGSFFTEADVLTQQRLQRDLQHVQPGPILGEEMTDDEQARLWSAGRSGMWCVDPIDGTTNFANGIPFFGISAAWLVEYETVFGVVHNPVTGESFYAAKGAGAYLNGVPLPLRAGAKQLDEAVAGVDFKRISHHLGDELVVRAPYYSQRNLGSSALEWCFVAAGRLDVYLHGGQRLWDYAAGRLILAEAGGMASTLGGDSLIAGPALKRSVIAAVRADLFEQWRNWVVSRA